MRRWQTHGKILETQTTRISSSGGMTERSIEPSFPLAFRRIGRANGYVAGTVGDVESEAGDGVFDVENCGQFATTGDMGEHPKPGGTK